MDDLYEQIVSKRIRPSTVLVSNRKSKNTLYYVVFGKYDNKIIGCKYLNKIPVADNDFQTDVRWFQIEKELKTNLFESFALDAKQLNSFHVVRPYNYLMDVVLENNLDYIYYNLINYKDRVKREKQIKIGSILQRKSANFYTIVLDIRGEKYLGTNVQVAQLKGVYDEIMGCIKKNRLLIYKANIRDLLADNYLYINTIDITTEIMKLKILGRI